MTWRREVYRDKMGRFVKRSAVWNGPPKPPHISKAEHKENMRQIEQRLLEFYCAPNPILKAMRAAGLVA